MKPQKKFTERYKEKVNSKNFLSTTEYIEKYRNNPLDQIKDAPKMFASRIELFWKDYHDKELNSLARQISLYFILETLVLIVNFFVIAYFIIHQ
jgi:hypothetical protein